jgi:hypothetical protein
MSNRLMKAWRCEYGGYDEIVYGPTASKARAARWRDLQDCCPDIGFADIRVVRAAASDIELPAEHPLVESLSHEERHRILHAYGYSNRPRSPQDWGYRNHYCTEPGCSIMAHMTSLGIFRGPHGVDKKGDTPGWAGAFWYLTDLGEQVARSLIPAYGEVAA